MTVSLPLAELDPAELDLLRRDDLTVDDIVSLPEDLRYELIDGRLVLTPLALPIHQLLSAETAFAIRQHCPDEFVFNVEQAVLIDRRNQARLRTDEIVTVDRPWEVTLDLPAWTRKRDRLRRAARRDR